ncbi:MAG: transposase [Smithella sp.]|jgi:transposase
MENSKDKKSEVEEAAEYGSTARMIKEVKRHTRKRFTAEEKVKIVLEGFRKETPVAELCRRESINAQVYYSWLKDFMEAGKSQLQKDNLRQANKSEVKELRKENDRLKNVVGDMALEINLLKKIMKK